MRVHMMPGSFDLVASEAIGLVRVDGQAGVEQPRGRFEVVSPGLHEARVAAEAVKQRNVPLCQQGVHRSHVRFY